MKTREFEYTPEISREIRNRIKIAVAAYAYEVEGDPIMSDGEFDELAKSIDLSIDTQRPDMDKWFRREFSASTGQWVWRHPQQGRLAYLADMFRRNK